MNRYVFSTKDTVRYRLPTHTNDLVMDRAEAETSEAFVVTLETGEATPLHVHHDTEQVFYVLEGVGVVQIGEAPEYYPVNPGDLVRIPPHTFHKIAYTGPQRLRYLCVDAFMGGRPKDEPTWDSHMRVVCEMNGWDFGRVRLEKSDLCKGRRWGPTVDTVVSGLGTGSLPRSEMGRMEVHT